MSWMIVGSNGQLGSALKESLQVRGIPVVSLASKDLDIRSLTECKNLILKLKPSVLINAAAYTNVDEAEKNTQLAYDTNAMGPLNLAKCAREINSVLVQLSTDYVFSGTSKSPWLENDQKSPRSIYGKSKAAGEEGVIDEYGERSYIMRTAWLYSPWRKNFVKTIIELARRDHEEITVVTNQIGQPTSALDLAVQIIEVVIAQIPFGIYHATNSGEVNRNLFAREILKLINVDENRISNKTFETKHKVARRPEYSVLSHERWMVPEVKMKGIRPMRNWRAALEESIPRIITAMESQARKDSVG